MDHLKRFFNARVQRTFGQLRIRDTPIVDHITNILATFARADQLYRLILFPSGRLEGWIRVGISDT